MSRRPTATKENRIPRVERQKRALASMRTWDRNYSAGDIGAIYASIRRWGFNGALRVWYDREDPDAEPPVVIAGNHTYLALLQMRDEDCDPPTNVDVGPDGDWYVDWVDVSHLSFPEAEAFAIADNRTTQLATYDEEKLATLLKEIAERDPADLDATGFDADDLDNLLRKLGQLDDSRPPAPEPRLDRLKELRDQWGTELGQLWEVPSLETAGRAHRILCGDSTDPEQVARLMAGERAVLFATDPPYLVGYDGTNHPQKWDKVIESGDGNKDWSDVYDDRWDDPTQGEELYDGFVGVALAEAVAPEAAWYCWHASRNQAMVERVWERHGAFVHQQIIWFKDHPILTRSWYMWQHEPCFFGWVRGKKPRQCSEVYPRSVWQFPRPRGENNEEHPTTKAVELFEIPMLEHTSRGDLVYEPFIGSGTQHVAAERLGRVCYGVEIQPAFVAVTLERLKEMGLTPRLVAPADVGTEPVIAE